MDEELRKRYEEFFNDVVRRIGLNVRVVYTPDSDSDLHGEYLPNQNLIRIYDSDPDDAYRTLIHEIVEARITPLINKYRVLVNKLIEFYERCLDIEKGIAG